MITAQKARGGRTRGHSTALGPVQGTPSQTVENKQRPDLLEEKQKSVENTASKHSDQEAKVVGDGEKEGGQQEGQQQGHLPTKADKGVAVPRQRKRRWRSKRKATQKQAVAPPEHPLQNPKQFGFPVPQPAGLKWANALQLNARDRVPPAVQTRHAVASTKKETEAKKRADASVAVFPTSSEAKQPAPAALTMQLGSNDCLEFLMGLGLKTNAAIETLSAAKTASDARKHGRSLTTEQVLQLHRVSLPISLGFQNSWRS